MSHKKGTTMGDYGYWLLVLGEVQFLDAAMQLPAKRGTKHFLGDPYNLSPITQKKQNNPESNTREPYDKDSTVQLRGVSSQG